MQDRITTNPLKKFGISLLNRIPYVKRLVSKVEVYEVGYPPGHYYSPVISLDDVCKHQETIFNRSATSLPGIDLREDEQLQLLEKFKEYYRDVPFGDNKQEGLRYRYKNGMY